MKLKNIIYLLLCIAAVSVVAACKEFLNPPLRGVYDLSQLTNKKGVNGLLVNAYATLDGREGAISEGASNWEWGSMAGGDAYKGTEFTDRVDDNPVMRFELTPANVLVLAKWDGTYDGIGQANNVLKVLANVTDMTDAEKIQVEAEARFIRAHHHFEAKKMWNNVPFIDENTTDHKGGTNTEDIWPKIEADFKFAYDNLDETKQYRGSANKWAAASFLAKAYMFQKKYADAKALFTTIIASGKNSQGVKYALTDNYHDNFRVNKENNSETIFAIQSSYGDGSTTNANYDNILNYPHGGGSKPGGCCGFFQPSQNMVNSFKTDATGLPMPDTYNAANVTSDEAFLSNDASFVMYTGNLDPRLDWTVGRRGVPYFDWGNHPGRDWIRDVTYGGPYSPKKNTYYKADEGSTAGKVGWGYSSNALNYTIMRYADVLLMAAEAEIETNNLEMARTYINMVRERAGKYAPSNAGPYFDAASAASYATYKVGLYTTAFASQDAARKAVRFERKLELGMEGIRFFDLVRWGIAATEINAYLTVEAVRRPTTLKDAKFTAGKHEYYPIPSAVITNIPGIEQNPGY
ncbi:RagB/SusD family nutrient uptake outer membrane protein [Foetidibacter luteolus]|uniref:RagB/SusD family nutrient uptake outer membrane protein n=1 Tax=Foetidibacter luteolus TaxID=2608880 RepID=UPI00129BBD7D|nr:RagB/SusD family nutrient uptake outer membrane protein [Foetidibacter luteolus]